MRNKSIGNPVLWFVVVALLLCLGTLWRWEENKPSANQPGTNPVNPSHARETVHCIVGVQVGLQRPNESAACTLHHGHGLTMQGVVFGLQTGFQKKGVSPQYDYSSRRAALRASWFPSSREALARVAQKDGLIVRFVIGHTLDARQEEAVALEDANHGGFLRLPIRVPACSIATMCSSLAAPCDFLTCLRAGRVCHLDHQDSDLPDGGHPDV